MTDSHYKMQGRVIVVCKVGVWVWSWTCLWVATEDVLGRCVCLQVSGGGGREREKERMCVCVYSSLCVCVWFDSHSLGISSEV